MKLYSDTRHTGFDWLGEIPNHWKTTSINAVTTPISIKNHSNEPLLSLYRDYGVILKDSRDDNHNRAGNDLSNYKLVQPNNLVINKMKAWQGSVGVSNYRGIISPAYIICKVREDIHSPYFNFLLRSNYYKHQYARLSYGVRTDQWDMRYSDFKKLPVLLPSLNEQKDIAKFLDDKLSLINTFISKKIKLIDLLNEKKNATLCKAVTKGLKTDVQLKPSGFDCLGDVPSHWEVRKLRFLGTCQNGISAGAEYFGSGYPFISYGDAYNNLALPDKPSGLANSTEEDRRRYSIQKGDILFTRTSETIAEIGFASTCLCSIANATFSGFLIRFRPFDGYLFEGFSKYFFRSQHHRSFFVKEMNLVTRASLSQDLLKELPVLLPSLEEQRQISEYLDREFHHISKAINTIKKEIALVEEFRTTLIAEAVTGKIDVRNYTLEDKLESVEA